MNVNTQRLRDTAAGAKEFASVGVVQWPHTAKAHINWLADAVATCCGEIDAQAAEIARLRDALTAIEHWEPPLVESRGEAVPMGVAYGSNGVRDYFRGIARAALSGESNAS